MGCTPCEEAARKRRELDEAKAAKRAERERDAALLTSGEIRRPAPGASARAKSGGKPASKKTAAKRAAPVVTPEPRAPRGTVPEGATVIPRDPRVSSRQPRQHRFAQPLDKDGAPIITAVPRVRPAPAAPPTSDVPHAPADTAGGAVV